MNNGMWRDEDFVHHYNELYCDGTQDNTVCLRHLALSKKDVFIDFGCGRGDCLSVAASLVRHATGIDNSHHQIEIARSKIGHHKNVSLIEGDFLGIRLEHAGYTKACARKALHHLNDTEKSSFFESVSEFFLTGSLFIVEDGIFSFDRDELPAKWNDVENEAMVYYGERWSAINDDFKYYSFYEFPTGITAWIHALAQGGFVPIDIKHFTSFYGYILARKG
ncbi:MAG: class I SAM-dependent methyltransferase [Oscillospiraceae bacterium]|nr:class I SAM-dependent methyltransferase [Oscillospiraceae bacterium]